MARLSFLVPSISIENRQIDNQMMPVLVNPQPILRPQFIPSMFSFALTIGLRGLDLSKQHKLQIRLLDPKDNQVFDSGVQTITPTVENITLHKEDHHLVLQLMVINVALRQNGDYKVPVILDGEVIETGILTIRSMEDPYDERTSSN